MSSSSSVRLTGGGGPSSGSQVPSGVQVGSSPGGRVDPASRSESFSASGSSRTIAFVDAADDDPLFPHVLGAAFVVACAIGLQFIRFSSR